MSISVNRRSQSKFIVGVVMLGLRKQYLLLEYLALSKELFIRTALCRHFTSQSLQHSV